MELGAFDVDGGHFRIRYDNSAGVLAGVECATIIIVAGRRPLEAGDLLATQAARRLDSVEFVEIEVEDGLQSLGAS
jgi:hypothetical protein